MIARLHFKEMVLSPEHAEKIRNLPEGAAAAQQVHHHHYEIKAMDSADVRRFLQKHKTEIFKASRDGARGAQRAMSLAVFDPDTNFSPASSGRSRRRRASNTGVQSNAAGKDSRAIR